MSPALSPRVKGGDSGECGAHDVTGGAEEGSRVGGHACGGFTRSSDNDNSNNNKVNHNNNNKGQKINS